MTVLGDSSSGVVVLEDSASGFMKSSKTAPQGVCEARGGVLGADFGDSTSAV